MTMEFLQNLIQNTEAPLLYTLLLGFLTAISPCQFARNITAIGYLSRDIEKTARVFVNGLFYTIGNATGYLLIGVILYLGASKFQISKILVSGGNIFTGLLLLIVGVIMLDVIKVRIPGRGRFLEKVQERQYRGRRLDSALLGFFFSLSFCPYNAALFFGMLIPLTITSPQGLVLPVVYSAAAGLPVIIISYLIAYSVAGIGVFYNKILVFQKWLNRVVAGIFIAAGIYFLYLFLLQRFFNS